MARAERKVPTYSRIRQRFTNACVVLPRWCEILETDTSHERICLPVREKRNGWWCHLGPGENGNPWKDTETPLALIVYPRVA
jgi:hypothetical protein